MALRFFRSLLSPRRVVSWSWLLFVIVLPGCANTLPFGWLLWLMLWATAAYACSSDEDPKTQTITVTTCENNRFVSREEVVPECPPNASCNYGQFLNYIDCGFSNGACVPRSSTSSQDCMSIPLCSAEGDLGCTPYSIVKSTVCENRQLVEKDEKIPECPTGVACNYGMGSSSQYTVCTDGSCASVTLGETCPTN